MVTEIIPGLYSIAVPLPNNPLKSLNAYVITGERNLLIDTGFRQDACREALLSGLQTLGVSMEHTDIFLTHLHSDHTGLAPEIRGRGTRIYIGARDLSHMPGPGSTFRWADSDRHFAAEGFPPELLKALTTKNPAQSLSPIPYDGYLPVEPGDVFSYGSHRFTAILTPGHTPGHMCLWEAETGVCILGDHVLFDITPNITRWIGTQDSLGGYLQSLNAIRQLPVKIPLPAHRTVHMDFHQRCDQLIQHHAARCNEVLGILNGNGAMTAWDIAARMTWKIRAKDWADFPTPQKWFAVGEAMAHLDHLIVLGQVQRQKQDALYTYQSISC